jgi:hypothetical protein
MLYRVHFADEHYTPYPPESLPSVEADAPLDAVRLLLEQRGPPAIDADTIWALVILTVHPSGTPRHVVSIPLTREFTIPQDWQPPAGAGEAGV